ncbi:B12-binding domain-containing radical SAM protein [Geotalea sp. SG265]|uniref:B12-binding domain-containing radical SAM protein n=1 Tax=Geotalea sp. SG265 TaxID=2922867 RepID=UPI001FAF5F58|nr:B12-binding domain-containing radical SAM protein [Geotalea sp. SG265]
MKVLLTTLHAKYVHASLALPYLAAACGDLEGVEIAIREFTVNEPSDAVLQQIVAEKADVVMFSCYIWNIEQTLKLAADLKLVQPEVIIVLGGPEASHGVFELLSRNPAIDCVVRGEGEETCRELLQALVEGQPMEEVAGTVCRSGEEAVAAPEQAPIASLDAIPSPFAARLADLKKPLVYYETSRGCPFSCAFCMSSLEKGVRTFSIERIRSDLEILMAGKVKTIKLVDRTFNFNAVRANQIWEYILQNNRESRFHFEIAADLLTEENLALLAKVPKDTFRFEIGIQSKDAGTLERVGRTSDLDKLFVNVARLRRETQVTLHLDLVAGLPEENYQGFLSSLQGLCELTPHHIQVEPLKVLKGTQMRAIAEREGYACSAAPPYKILRTPWLSFEEICRIETVSRLVELFYNSGRFGASLNVLAGHAPLAEVFHAAADFWQEEAIGQQLSLAALFEVLWRFGRKALPPQQLELLRESLCYDFCLADYPAAGRLPSFFAGTPSLESTVSREKIASIIRKSGIGKESKVRSFRWHFSHNFRQNPATQEPADLLFLYVSAPGKGLQVLVLDEADPV